MRRRLKGVLARVPDGAPARGVTTLIYHRVGGGSPDERDLAPEDFERHVELLADVDVLPLDEAADRQQRGDDRPGVVLTFDDGFADVHEHAWPLLREAQLPFALYLSTAFVGGTMHWDGSTAKAAGPALEWEQLREMVASGLCTVGNHTHAHVRPELLTEEELDRCTGEVQDHLGTTPQHFAYTWGVPVPAMDAAVRRRFRTAATGEVGRALPGDDPVRWRRVPVRRTDPPEFFAAKLTGALRAERAYARVVGTAKAVGLRG